MNLSQAIQIVRDHVRIGKGMGLTNGVPEALEILVEELERQKKCYDVTNQSWKELKDQLAVTEKALELACDEIERLKCSTHPSTYESLRNKKYFLHQAKAGDSQ